MHLEWQILAYHMHMSSLMNLRFEQIAQAVLFSSLSAILNEVNNSHYVGAWLQCLCNLHSKDFLNSVVVGHIARRPRVAYIAS